MNNNSDNQHMIVRFIAAMSLATFSAVIAFFATCKVVTEGAVRIVAPDARGEALNGNFIVYGLFLGIPLGIVVAWLVARTVEKAILKSRKKK